MRHLIALALLAALVPTVAPAGPAAIIVLRPIIVRPVPPSRPATPARPNTDHASTSISGPGVGITRPAPVVVPFAGGLADDDRCIRPRDNANPACQPLRK